MTSRKEKLEDIINAFQAIKKNMAFPKLSGIEASITPSQWMALRIIDHHGQISIKEIAKELTITSSATTQLIDGLVFSGYVIKEEGNLDKRFVMVKLSKGAKKQIHNLKKQAMVKLLLVFKKLNDKEFNQYYLLNKKILKT